MKISAYRFAAGLALLLAMGGAIAQDRPPEGVSPEERRAFYQKRAAAREAAGETGGGRPSEAQIAEWRAKRAAAAGAEAPAPAAEHNHDMTAAGHDHGGAAAPAVPGAARSGNPNAGSKPEAPASAGRPTEAGRGGMPGMGAMGGMRGSGALWLSDSPPSRGDGPPRGGMGGRGGMAGMAGMGGMSGMPGMGGERSGPPVKRLWLRAGSDPQKSGFAREDADAIVETLLVKPQGSPEGEPLPQAEDGKRNLSFEMPVQGYYRLYLTTRKLQGDTLSVSVAKSEIANFSHGGDEEERAQGIKATRVLESAPIEIVREKKPDEKMFFQLRSGEEQPFVVLQKGLPVQGARVRFVSHQGWSKEAVSDEQGRVVFQIVRDYFPSWQDFQRRFKATYLVIAETNVAENGRFKDQSYANLRYQATLSGAYYPSPDDYRSYAWGLGIGFVFLLFCGTVVYLYRRRRVKPFQEVRFDEKP